MKPFSLLFVVLSVVCGKQTVVDLSHQHRPGIVAYPVYPDMNFTILSRGIRPDISGLWCDCQNCMIVRTAVENLCCQEVGEITEKTESNGIGCIPEHDGFIATCLIIDSVETAIFEYLESHGPVEFNQFETVEHYGTHLDAPAHMLKDMWRLHQVPVHQFFGPAVVIDITERAKINPDSMVMVSDLLAWEEKYGEIPEGAMVLMRSGWDKKFSKVNDFFGSSTPKDGRTFHYPGFSPESTKWLVENRPKFNGIGVDTISLDHGPSLDFQAHVNLFTGNKIGYENLANLETLPEAGAMFYAIPINLYDGSGCPVRAVGIIDDATNGTKTTQSPVCVTDEGTSGSQKITQSIVLAFLGISVHHFLINLI